MEEPQLSSPPAAITKPRKRRVKTGCHLCRVRRRKCDEAKPRCSRCADRDLECVYPTGLTFLDKNIVTIAPLSPRASSAPKYSRLQFVDTTSFDQIAHKSSSATQQAAGDVSQPRPHKNATVDGGSKTITMESLMNTTDISPGAEVEMGMAFGMPDHHSEPPVRESPRDVAEATSFDTPDKPPSERFNTALQALLSLNNDPLGPFAGSPSIIDEQSNNNAFTFGYTPSDTGTTSYDGAVQHVAQKELPVTDEVPDEDAMRLIRHYRYELAPWLDICDLRQFFGTVVPRMARTSTAIRRELLAMSFASLNPRSHSQDLEAPELLLAALREEVASGNCVSALLMTLRGFMSTPPSVWHTLLNSTGIGALAAHYPSQENGQYLSCLQLRLDLTVALVSGTTLPLEHISDVQGMLQWDPTHVADTMFQYVSRVLVLCAQAVNICAEDPVYPQGHGTGFTLAQQWRIIAEDLNTWYTNRPHEYQPMVELDLRSNNAEPLFPTVLFTNGVAVLGNQLYHTAIMFMLQHKPRTLVLDARRSPAWSPLWHAQRVCGIALSNERREYWDLTLVASLYVAAKGMTYEPQQREILRCFDAVSRVVGWNIGQFKWMLAHTWDMPDGGG